MRDGRWTHTVRGYTVRGKMLFDVSQSSFAALEAELAACRARMNRAGDTLYSIEVIEHLDPFRTKKFWRGENITWPPT